jgi:hypothetical protein
MKRYIFLLLLLLLFTLANLFSITKLTEIKLENIAGTEPNNQNILLFPNYHYSVKKELLFAKLKTFWKIDNGIKIQYSNNFYGIYVFNKNGKKIKNIGKFNSRDTDGFISLSAINVNQNKIYFYDYEQKKMLVFSENYPFNFLSIITDPEKILDSNAIHFLWNEYVFADQTSDAVKKNNLIFTKSFMRTSYGEIAQIKPNHKIVVTSKKICSYKTYSDILWNDGIALKNKSIQRDIKIVNHDPIHYMNASMPFTGAMDQFIPNGDDTLFVVNDFGMDIRQYDRNVTLIDSFYVGDIYMKHRLKELSKIKNFIKNKYNGKHEWKFFTKDYPMTILNGALYDKKKNNMLMIFDLKKYFLENLNLPKAKTYLLIYSLKNREAISNFIPLDFYPIQFDSDKRELIGIQKRFNNLYLQFYDIKKIRERLR